VSWNAVATKEVASQYLSPEGALYRQRSVHRWMNLAEEFAVISHLSCVGLRRPAVRSFVTNSVASNPPPPVDVGDQPPNPGGLGDGSPPAGVQGAEPPGGGVGGEAPRKLRAF
jgi:hypothetical protein